MASRYNNCCANQIAYQFGSDMEYRLLVTLWMNHRLPSSWRVDAHGLAITVESTTESGALVSGSGSVWSVHDLSNENRYNKSENAAQSD